MKWAQVMRSAERAKTLPPNECKALIRKLKYQAVEEYERHLTRDLRCAQLKHAICETQDFIEWLLLLPFIPLIYLIVYTIKAIKEDVK